MWGRRQSNFARPGGSGRILCRHIEAGETKGAAGAERQTRQSSCHTELSKAPGIEDDGGSSTKAPHIGERVEFGSEAASPQTKMNAASVTQRSLRIRWLMRSMKPKLVRTRKVGMRRILSKIPYFARTFATSRIIDFPPARAPLMTAG